MIDNQYIIPSFILAISSGCNIRFPLFAKDAPLLRSFLPPFLFFALSRKSNFRSSLILYFRSHIFHLISLPLIICLIIKIFIFNTIFLVSYCFHLSYLECLVSIDFFPLIYRLMRRWFTGAIFLIIQLCFTKKF